ncbi:MAG: PAN domain-containing protein [Xanthobacteraceae bacterium]
MCASLSLCEQDNACRAFTYNSMRQVCILKSSYGEVRNFPGAISGEKR